MPRLETDQVTRRIAPLRTGRFAGWMGGSVVAFMLLLCLLSLPYTLGHAPAATDADDTSAARFSTRRFEATNLELILVPPFWAPHADDELQRVATVEENTTTRPRPWLGTDRLGRDFWVRCLAGGGISLIIGLSAAAIAVIIGTLYGTIAGYCGGRIDAIMMRIVDILFGLPYILLVVLLAVASEGLVERAQEALTDDALPKWFALMCRFIEGHKPLVNILTLLTAIGGLSWLTMARVIRGQVLSLKEQPFMEAARAIGVSRRMQFLRHLLPNLIGPIVVYATLSVPTAILSESFLSFLGIGVQEPLPSWGNLAADGLSELNTVRVRWWLLFWPCLFIAITLLSLNFVGEDLRQRFDPKRRTSVAPTT